MLHACGVSTSYGSTTDRNAAFLRSCASALASYHLWPCPRPPSINQRHLASDLHIPAAQDPDGDHPLMPETILPLHRVVIRRQVIHRGRAFAIARMGQFVRPRAVNRSSLPVPDEEILSHIDAP